MVPYCLTSVVFVVHWGKVCYLRLRWCCLSVQAVLQMPAEVQSELCRQNLIPSFPRSRRSIVAEHPLILLEQLLMNEKVCVSSYSSHFKLALLAY